MSRYFETENLLTHHTYKFSWVYDDFAVVDICADLVEFSTGKSNIYPTPVEKFHGRNLKNLMSLLFTNFGVIYMLEFFRSHV